MPKGKKAEISEKTDRPSEEADAKTAAWKFYRHPAVEWLDWYNDRNIPEQAKHDEVFEVLESRVSWQGSGYAEMLKGGHKIVEIKVKKGVQWRLMGFYGANKQTFILTMICNHKGTVYDPPSAIDTAVSRMKEIQNRKVKEVACDRPGKDS